MPFGVPTSLRCDEQTSFYNSSEFFTFMSNYKIKLEPTAVAAPYSNSRAESGIKNIKKLAKKFLFQEHCLEKWDDYISILTNVHNSSVGIYGVSAEQVMFATKIPNNSDILSFDWSNDNDQQIIETLFKKAEEIRNKTILNKQTKNNQNKTYKNATRILKTFDIGTLVLNRQMQVSTGKGSGYKPKFTGPYIILSLNKDDSTALIEHINTNAIVKAHFSNLQLLYFDHENLKYTMNIPDNLLNNLNEASNR